MAKAKPIHIDEVQGHEVAKDGRTASVQVSTKQGLMALELPAEKIPALMQQLSSAAGESARIVTRDPSMKHAVSVEWWGIGATDKKVVLAFRMAGGAEQAFQVPKEQVDAMVEALSAIRDGKPAAGPR